MLNNIVKLCTEIKCVSCENLWMIVLAFLCLMLFGCSYPVAVRPSPLLTRDCTRPELVGNTYRDAIILSIEQDKAIEECTARMKAIRK